MQHRSIYSFLWSVIRPFKGCYLVMLMAPVLGSFCDFSNNYALKLIVDLFSNDQEVSNAMLMAPVLLFIGGQVLLDMAWRISDIAEWRSEPHVRKEILRRVYGYVQNCPYSFFQNTQAGSITSRIKGIIDGYDNFWAAMHHEFTPRLVNTVVLTGTLAIVDLKICLMVACWAAIFFIIMYRFSLALDRYSFINSSHRHQALGYIADGITNILTVLSFSRKRYELGRLDNFVDEEFIPSSIKVYKTDFIANVVAAIQYWVILLGLFLYMIHLRKTHQVSSGDVVFVMGITLKMSFELWHLVRMMQKFMKDIGDFKSAFSLMQTPQSSYEIDAHLPAIAIKRPCIEFREVEFSYPDQSAVLEHLNVAIRAGEKIGLVGMSGAGKSTIVSLLLRYFEVSRGQILIDGQDIKGFSPDSVRQEIAVIPQDILLFHRSIFDNIRYGRRDASMEEVKMACEMANIHGYIQGLPQGYDSMVGERGIRLSGGQRQRIAIARAILKNAPILILDEATSSLDTETERLIQESLRRLFHNSTTTVIAIAHRLSTIKNLDRIIVLDQGKISAVGSHESLINKSEIYRKLWQGQAA